jgi:hypothetical protein
LKKVEQKIMAMNQLLSAEMTLVRFFDATLLGTYCKLFLGKYQRNSATILSALHGFPENWPSGYNGEALLESVLHLGPS